MWRYVGLFRNISSSVGKRRHTPGGVLCNASILSRVLPKHDLPGAWEFTEEAARVVDDEGRHVHSLAVVSLPQIEHRLEGTEEFILHFLGWEAKQPQVTA